MSTELETAGMASAGALTDPVARGGRRAICSNCGADTVEKYCPNCGQLNKNFHRPLVKLIGEIVAETFSFDGRLARTLPALMISPGKVTKAYLEGKRAAYVPPFRLYLIASLVFFGVVFGLIERSAPEEVRFDPSAVAESDVQVQIAGAQANASDLLNEDGSVNREAVYDILLEEFGDPDSKRMRRARVIVDQLINAYENQTLLQMILQEWAPRLSLLLFPVFALFLTLVYAWRRGLFVYDHVITALHFQTFIYLLSVVLLGAGFFIGGWAAPVFFLAPAIYLYRMLRTVYGTGRIMSAARMFVLLGLTTVSVFTLTILLLVIGVSQV